MLRTFACLLVLKAVWVCAAEHDARPQLYWSAEPVLPGETAMLQGWGFGDVTKIELAPLGTDHAKTAVNPLYASKSSLRLVIPEDWKPGIYRVSVQGKGGMYEHVLNLPQPWWWQADNGRTATPGGWVRISGRCLWFNETAKLELRAQGQTWPLVMNSNSMWSVEGALPAGIEAGEYELWIHNGCGQEAGWVRVEGIRVAAPEKIGSGGNWLVTDLGAVPDDADDDGSALQKALDEVQAKGGGTVRFPRGRFRFSGGFKLPPNVSIQGAGRELTHLVWADTATPPDSFFSSETGRLRLEDLSLYAHNYRSGLVVKAPKDAPTARDVRVARVTVRFTPLSVKGLSKEEVQKRRDDAAKSAVFSISADNVQIIDCDLAWLRSIGLSVQGNDIVCRGNRAFAEVEGWCPVGGGRRAIVENNQLTGVIAGITRGAEVYFARNKVSHVYHGFREGFTTDGAFGGPGLLVEPKVDGRTIEHAGAAARIDPAHIPAAVRIVDGAGAGQYRWVERFEQNRVVMDRPFDVPPDASSAFYVCNAMARHILFDNDMSDTGTAGQLYGGAIDCVIANNRSSRAGGFRLWGNESACYVQMLGNRIAEGYGTIGPELNGGSSALHVVGPYLTRNGIRFTGTTVRGIVIRGNELENNASIVLRAAIHDVQVEQNRIKHASKGIVGDLWQRQQGVVLRDNRFDDVTTPLEPAKPGYLDATGKR